MSCCVLPPLCEIFMAIWRPKGLEGWGQRSEAWRRATEEEGTTKQCQAIHGLLVSLIYGQSGAFDGRRGHVNRRCIQAKHVCALQSCKSRCWLIFLRVEGQQWSLEPHPSLALLPYWNKENKPGRGTICKQAKCGGITNGRSEPDSYVQQTK